MTTHHCREAHTRPGAVRKGHGPSSMWLHDAEHVFQEIGLRQGMNVLDAGCGAGEYALHAARRVGERGRVLALDNVQRSIDCLLEEAASQDLRNVSGQACDITTPLALDNASVDVVLLATVLHIRSVRERCAAMFREFRRVLRPSGCLAVIECKKEETGFGPPKEMRLSEEDVRGVVLPCGFNTLSATRFRHTYLLLFQPDSAGS